MATGPLTVVDMYHPSSAPGVCVTRYRSTGQLYRGVKEQYAVSLVESGESEWWLSGGVHRSGPGSIAVKQPGDVHRDLRRDGASRFQVVTFDDRLVTAALEAGPSPRSRRRAPAQIDPRHPDAGVFRRLHEGLARGGDGLGVEEAVAEALGALVSQLYSGGEARPEPRDHVRPNVRRALALLHASEGPAPSLAALAARAGLDRFHLCRAFRQQIGLPPHAYLTHLRVNRARRLLAAGMPPGEVAMAVGFSDQSQLNRHFRRIVRLTPGRYARLASR